MRIEVIMAIGCDECWLMNKKNNATRKHAFADIKLLRDYDGVILHSMTRHTFSPYIVIPIN